jgi:spore coat polysaccharide biosynthesis protein SpsF
MPTHTIEPNSVSSSPRIVAIVQARMNSSRLPGKALLRVGNIPLIQHVSERVNASKSVDKVIFAIPDTAENKILDHFLRVELGQSVYLGSETDVLGRFAGAIADEQATYVVRVTADDPLKDPALIDHAVDLIINDPKLRYVTNSINASFPEGLDVEVFHAESLLYANDVVTEEFSREHVTPHLWLHPEMFPTKHFNCPIDLSDWRWTLDTFEDWIFLDSVLKTINSKSENDFNYQTVVHLLESDRVIRDLMPRQERSVSKVRNENDI